MESNWLNQRLLKHYDKRCTLERGTLRNYLHAHVCLCIWYPLRSLPQEKETTKKNTHMQIDLFIYGKNMIYFLGMVVLLIAKLPFQKVPLFPCSSYMILLIEPQCLRKSFFSWSYLIILLEIRIFSLHTNISNFRQLCLIRNGRSQPMRGKRVLSGGGGSLQFGHKSGRGKKLSAAWSFPSADLR